MPRLSFLLQVRYFLVPVTRLPPIVTALIFTVTRPLGRPTRRIGAFRRLAPLTTFTRLPLMNTDAVRRPWWNCLRRRMVNARRLMHAHRLKKTFSVFGAVLLAAVYCTSAVTVWRLSLRSSGLILIDQRPAASGLASALIFLPSILNVIFWICEPLTSRRNVLETHFFGLETKSATPDFTFSARTACCGWLSTVVAAPVAATTLPSWSAPSARAVLLTAVWPAAVWTLHLYVQVSPGSSVPGDGSAPPPRVLETSAGAVVHVLSVTLTVDSANATSPGLVTAIVNSTALPAVAVPGPVLLMAIAGWISVVVCWEVSGLTGSPLGSSPLAVPVLTRELPCGAAMVHV